MTEKTTDEMTEEKAVDFVVRARFAGPDLVGARWWNESFETYSGGSLFGRRPLLMPLALSLGMGAVTGLVFCFRSDDEGPEVSLAALELQRKEGWNAGYQQRALLFPPSGGPMLNALGTLVTPPDLTSLGERLAGEPRLRPYAANTLFQALADPGSASLVASMRPVHTPAMDEAYARGVALRDLMARPEAPAGVALIADLPGPESVALAAGLADRFAPVFTFDNWPHPLGVVPSHLVLGAAAYYLPVFEAGAYRRPAQSMPVFVLDANRLAPYRDQAEQFDNRYVAPVPSAEALTRLGIKRLLYLRPDGNSLTELDDLNADFVAWQQAGIEVRAVALSDFTAQQDALATRVTGGAPYYYGGHAHFYPVFWRSYGWGPATAIPLRQPLPSGLSSAPAYRPSFRPTMFASRTMGGVAGVGKQKPSGFGRVSVRMSGGRVSSFGGTSRRSGSFGRSRSSFFG
jgi:hypothetical protein